MALQCGGHYGILPGGIAHFLALKAHKISQLLVILSNGWEYGQIVYKWDSGYLYALVSFQLLWRLEVCLATPSV